MMQREITSSEIAVCWVQSQASKDISKMPPGKAWYFQIVGATIGASGRGRLDRTGVPARGGVGMSESFELRMKRYEYEYELFKLKN